MDDSLRRRKTGGATRRFSQEDVLDAAVRLADEHGLDTVSMRRLAQVMGVATMTLYSYFSTKEELLDAASAHCLRAVISIDRSLPWDLQLTAAARDVHAALLTHPGVVELLIAKGATHGPALDAVRESLLSILYLAGFNDSAAVDGMLSVFSFAFGTAIVERARIRPAAERISRFSSLSESDFPALIRAAPEYATRMPGPAFEYGLQHLINGIRADHRRLSEDRMRR